MAHEHDHAHDHGHQHGHGHDHGGGDGFDWEAMADVLERDAAIAAPIVRAVTGAQAAVLEGAVRVLDLGCGPGTAIVELARAAPHAEVVGVDANAALLARVRHRAAAASLDERLRTVTADIESSLVDQPGLGGPAGSDLVWASMVMHHVADPVSVLGQIRELLRPGGVVVLLEFAGSPVVVDARDPTAAAWDRLEAAVAAKRRARLGLDPVTVDWPPLLATAGFVDVDDRVLVAVHDAPLGVDARAWIRHHVERGLDWVVDDPAGQLSSTDVAALQALAAAVDDRDDLVVRVERRVVTACRPA